MKAIWKQLLSIVLVLILFSTYAFAFEELKTGSKGEEVVKLQEWLNDLGYSVGTPDGDFDISTKKALMRFQMDHYLDYTGVLDEATYNSILSEIEYRESKTPEEKTEISSCSNSFLTRGNIFIVNEDGTVTLYGNNQDYESLVPTWSNVASIGGSFDELYITKQDGTVDAIATHDSGLAWQESRFKEVESWSNIIKVKGEQHVIGLKNDGTLVYSDGMEEWEKELSLQGEGDEGWIYLSDVLSWSGIIDFAMPESGWWVIGLKENGEIEFVGVKRSSQQKEWEPIEFDKESWRNITQIESGFMHTVGLRSDGTVVAYPESGYDFGSKYNTRGQTDVEEWKDITAIYAGGNLTIGITNDGSVMAAGSILLWDENTYEPFVAALQTAIMSKTGIPVSIDSIKELVEIEE